jgi:pyruvate/2-oxoglutarate dehydrogenase complex dihydrolipoamide acyltransferase (E2) component
MIYQVTVKQDYRWKSARISGRVFFQSRPIAVPEARMNDEILNSPILDVVGSEAELVEETEQPGETEIDASAGAVELAQAEGVDLSQVTGTGKGGKIIKSDVEAYTATYMETLLDNVDPNG